jgi:hypothetical protein
VAAADGVPGIPRRIEDTDPPVIPPMYTPNRRVTAANGAMRKVRGRSRMIPIEYVNPGMAPNTIPTKEPRIMIRIICRFKA